jgi:hypothetical protein
VLLYRIKEIRVSLRGLVIILGLVVPCATAYAQTDYSAGKTPAQLFSGDCSVCHKSPRGLAKNRDARTLTGFLREHYTSKTESAGALAAYLLGNPGAPADAEARKRQGTPGTAAPGEEGAPRQQATRGKKQTPAELAREREAAAKATEEAAKAKLRGYASTGETARPLVSDAAPAKPAVEAAPVVPAPATAEPATPPAPAEAPKAEVGTAPAETSPPAAERPASTPPG